MSVVTLQGESRAPRLTPEEVEKIFQFAFQVHDHYATRPQPPIFWHRSNSDAFWNYRFDN